jgi:hypothetical protein
MFDCINDQVRVSGHSEPNDLRDAVDSHLGQDSLRPDPIEGCAHVPQKDFAMFFHVDGDRGLGRGWSRQRLTLSGNLAIRWEQVQNGNDANTRDWAKSKEFAKFGPDCGICRQFAQIGLEMGQVPGKPRTESRVKKGKDAVELLLMIVSCCSQYSHSGWN